VSAAQRLLIHAGFFDVRIVDGANDNGADIICGFRNQKWVVQSKWTSGKFVDEVGVQDCERALAYYGADKALLVTNAKLSPKARRRVSDLTNLGLSITVWEHEDLETVWQTKLSLYPATSFTLRPYQEEAKKSCLADLEERRRALLVLATGLGKTAVASEIVREAINNGAKKVLVLAHLKELVQQLEVSFWPKLPKTFNTSLLTGDETPTTFDGLLVATVDSALNLIETPYAPDLIVVDEAHHVGPGGMYDRIISHYSKSMIVGLTATPWRGDKFDIQTVFGKPSFSMGIAEGMAQGFLSSVDYRIFADNIDWDFVKTLSKNSYSIKELNKKLFLPDRDDRIVDELKQRWYRENAPQALVFCATIEHAERVASLLRSSDPAWSRTQTLHSGMSRQDRNNILNNFRLKRIPVLACVDVFNEGVDVPEVSIIAFLRVTHSRRIFIQQLGRGLRLSPGKEKLHVLDFVTDIRRIAATTHLRSELADNFETLHLQNTSSIEFEDATSGRLLDYWIMDAADLETSADDVVLNFPDSMLHGQENY